MSKKTHDIEQDEKAILQDLENGEFVTSELSNKNVAQAKQAAKKFMKRDNRINIRISGSDLNMIRRIAIQEGLPYQTLLASVIHKFAAGRLSDNHSGPLS